MTSPQPVERAPEERLVNLVVSLEASSQPRTFAQLRADTRAYVQEDHESARRMFERDKDTLRRMGVPIETVDVDGVAAYRIDRDRWQGTQVDLTREEATALAVGIGLAGGQAERLALSRLAARAPDPDDDRAVAAEAAAPRLRLSLADDGLDAVAEAVAARATLRFGYRRADGHEATRTVDAWGLTMHNGAAYLVGWDHARRARRTFRLSRLTSQPRRVAAAGTPPPDDFDITTVFDDRPRDGTDVDLLVHTTAVAAVERRGGALLDRPAVVGPDGATWHHARLPDADAQRLIAWLWARSEHVVVTAPPDLAADVADGLSTVASRAAGGAP